MRPISENRAAGPRRFLFRHGGARYTGRVCACRPNAHDSSVSAR